MQTNIPIQTVLIHKIRSISKPILRLAKETGCAPDILHSYHTILSQRPQLEQSKHRLDSPLTHAIRPSFSHSRYIRYSDRRLLFRRIPIPAHRSGEGKFSATTSTLTFIRSSQDPQSPWPIIRGDHPARTFFDGKSSSLAYNIELDYVQLFHRPLNDFLTALCTLFATYTVFEITYGKLEMTLSFLDCLLRDNHAHTSTRSPQVLELITELNSMKC